MPLHPSTAGGLAAGLAFVALTAVAAPPQAPAPPKGLVLHLGFGMSDPGPTIPDASGLNNPGKLSGTRWVAAGKQGAGCELSAPTDVIEVADSDSLALKQFTLAAWFRTSKSSPSWSLILDQGLADGFALGIGGDAGDASSRGKLGATVDSAGVCLSDAVVADGAWHHGAATFDGQSLRLFVDGLPQRQGLAATAPVPSNPEHIGVGKVRPAVPGPAPSRSFEGTLDEVMVFNRALSADEIKAMVLAVDPAAGKPKFTKQQIAGRLRQLKLLHDEGLLTDDFYNRKVAECEAAAP